MDAVINIAGWFAFVTGILGAAVTLSEMIPSCAGALALIARVEQYIGVVALALGGAAFVKTLGIVRYWSTESFQVIFQLILSLVLLALGLIFSFNILKILIKFFSKESPDGLISQIETTRMIAIHLRGLISFFAILVGIFSLSVQMYQGASVVGDINLHIDMSHPGGLER